MQCVSSVTGILPVAVVGGYLMIYTVYVLGAFAILEASVLALGAFIQVSIWNEHRLTIPDVCPQVYAYWTQ